MFKIKIEINEGMVPVGTSTFMGARTKYVQIESINDDELVLQEIINFINTIEGANNTRLHAHVYINENDGILDCFFINGKLEHAISKRSIESS